jgi:hypothetical protein
MDIFDNPNKLQKFFDLILKPNTKKNKKMKKKNEKLTTQNKQLTTQNETLTTQNEKLTTQNETLTTQNEKLTTQNETLTTQNETLNLQIKSLEGENSILSQQLQDCHKELQDNNNSISSQIYSLTSENKSYTELLNFIIDNYGFFDLTNENENEDVYKITKISDYKILRKKFLGEFVANNKPFPFKYFIYLNNIYIFITHKYQNLNESYYMDYTDSIKQKKITIQYNLIPTIEMCDTMVDDKSVKLTIHGSNLFVETSEYHILLSNINSKLQNDNYTDCFDINVSKYNINNINSDYTKLTINIPFSQMIPQQESQPLYKNIQEYYNNCVYFIINCNYGIFSNIKDFQLLDIHSKFPE